MKITIEVTPGTVKRVLILGGGLLVMGLAAAAYAVPVTYVDGNVLNAKDLNDNFTSVEQRLAALETADPACPPGYTKDATNTTIVDCTNGNDEVVKVGAGASAFWIDRYEASVWDGATQRFASADDTSAAFPKNGQTKTPWIAKSVKGVTPARYITWFQAQQACRASGKRLPNGEEWLAAGRGTPDPGSNTGTSGLCVTSASGPRNTGDGSLCQSDWGAQDMIGNLWEWTSEWYAGLGDTTQGSHWPTGYGTGETSPGNDGTWNITSSTYDGVSTTLGLPSAALRGGFWSLGTSAGLFAQDLFNAPTNWTLADGFRCLLPR